MSELNFTKLADAPVLEEVPDGAKVYAEVDGKVYRVAGDNLGGGGIKTAIFKLNADSGDGASVQSLLSGGVATLDAGDNARVGYNPVYTATCDNMTYEKCKAIFLAGGSVNARLVAHEDADSGTGYVDEPSISGGYFNGDGIETCGFAFSSYIKQYDIVTFYWLPDGTITTDMSALGGR